MRTRTHNDINQWLKFFLTGIIENCKRVTTLWYATAKKKFGRKIKVIGNHAIWTHEK
jgi:hypothetical protein